MYFITSDMTRKEGDINQKLRKELKQKRDNGETGWFIRNGKLQKSFH